MLSIHNVQLTPSVKVPGSSDKSRNCPSASDGEGYSRADMVRLWNDSTTNQEDVRTGRTPFRSDDDINPLEDLETGETRRRTNDYT